MTAGDLYIRNLGSGAENVARFMRQYHGIKGQCENGDIRIPHQALRRLGQLPNPIKQNPRIDLQETEPTSAADQIMKNLDLQSGVAHPERFKIPDRVEVPDFLGLISDLETLQIRLTIANEAHEIRSLIAGELIPMMRERFQCVTYCQFYWTRTLFSRECRWRV